MIPHLLRCQGFAVNDYSFTLERLESAASSTFATLGQVNRCSLGSRLADAPNLLLSAESPRAASAQSEA